jgi:uncharacterized protein YcgL (UPF0745 family)
MLCAIYKSPKKQQTYLFVLRRNDFSDVPGPLLKTFGTPTLVTLINLATKEKLAMADLNTVKTRLSEQGYYLQLPPPQENLLDEHKISLKRQQEQS